MGQSYSRPWHWGCLPFGTKSLKSWIPLTVAGNSLSVPDADELSTRFSWATGVTPHRFAEPNSAVISMAQSADGKLWLGTRDKGLFYMMGGRSLFGWEDSYAGRQSTACDALRPQNCGSARIAVYCDGMELESRRGECLLRSLTFLFGP